MREDERGSGEVVAWRGIKKPTVEVEALEGSLEPGVGKSDEGEFSLKLAEHECLCAVMVVVGKANLQQLKGLVQV
jgi:hypothetical protein